MATGRVGGGWFGRLASASVAPAAGFPLRLRRRRARVVVEGVSHGVAVSQRGSRRCERGQGVSEVAARCVASACPRRAHVRRERHAGRHGRALVWPMQCSSSTMAGARWSSRVRWRATAWWPGWGRKDERGRSTSSGTWPAWPCHASYPLLLSSTMCY